MNNPARALLACVSIALGVTGAAPAGPVEITTDMVVACDDDSLDGLDVVVDGAVLTIDCAHTFTSLQLVNDAVLTHADETTGLHLTITGNMHIDATSAVDVSGRGHQGGEGPGVGWTTSCFCCTHYGGGGYGGRGGIYPCRGSYSGGHSYGDLRMPVDLGSGGRSLNEERAGGAVRLTVDGTLTVDGAIRSDGEDADQQGEAGPSGGSVLLEAGTLAGAGVISATGGDGNGGTSIGGSGAGGRIAIHYGASVFTGEVLAHGGQHTSQPYDGGAGTVLWNGPAPGDELLVIDNAAGQWGTTDMNGRIEIDGDMVVRGGAIVSHTEPGHSFSPPEPAPLCGLHLVIAGDLTIEADGMIAAQGRGYPQNNGPGKGGTHAITASSGGGYGGMGGGSTGGIPYGSEQAPFMLGSGAGKTDDNRDSCGDGGGALWLTVEGSLLVDGTISANGGWDELDGIGLGGSGGSVLIEAPVLDGTGPILAEGEDANGNSKGGGGGRIALYVGDNAGYTGTLSVAGGSGGGFPGTIFEGTYPSPLTDEPILVSSGESIQAALDTVLPGGEIIIAPGTYTEALQVVNPTILRSEAGAALTVIDATEVDPARPLLIDRVWSGADCGPTVVDGFTLTGGNGTAEGLWGGGAYVSNSDATFLDCVFTDNEAEFGGGVAVYPAGTNRDVRFERCLFQGNTASGAEGGGGLGIWSADEPGVSVIDCIFRDNDAVQDGGAILVRSTSVVSFDNCLIDDNHAGDDGGAVQIKVNAYAALRTCTIVANTSTDTAAGVQVDSDSAGCDVQNTIVRGNTGGSGNIAGPAAVMYSNVEGYAGAGVDGNIDEDALFMDAPGGDYHLLPESPCVDAGDNGLVPGSVATDLEGNDRTADGDGDFAPVVDMGVYERPGACADTDGDDLVDVDDLVAVILAWGPCEGDCPEDINGDGTVDVGDLVAVVLGWGPC